MNIETWQERFSEYLAVLGRAPRTIRSYRFELRMFLRFLSDRGLQSVPEITREDVEAYQVELLLRRKPNGEPLTIGTRNTKTAAMLAFLNFLTEAQYVLVNPGARVRLARAPKPLLPKLPDNEQILRLLEVPDTSTPLGLRDRAIMELFYSSGLRNTELRLLKIADVDLARLWVRVVHGKGNKPRMVPLGEPAAAWIEEYLANGRGFLVRHKDPGYLFLSRYGNVFSLRGLCDRVKIYSEASGLSMRITPHLFRHCCATHMLENQAGIRFIQEFLGHVSADTTQRYTQVELSQLREMHRRCHPRELL